jgi:NAD(P)-dependent dehydrogenase (short-subunit alcohol dehydrogenase family)
VTVRLDKEVAKKGIWANVILPGIFDTKTHANRGEPNLFAERSPLMPVGRDGNLTKLQML